MQGRSNVDEDAFRTEAEAIEADVTEKHDGEYRFEFEHVPMFPAELEILRVYDASGVLLYTMHGYPFLRICNPEAITIRIFNPKDEVRPTQQSLARTHTSQSPSC